MRDERVLMVVWLFFMIPLLPGCPQAKPVPRDLPVRVIRSSAHCGAIDAGCRLTWIRDPEAFQGALEKGRSALIPGGGTQVSPHVDFRTHGVLWIEMGMRPTAGYGFDGTAVRAVLVGNTVILELVTVAPDPGVMHAQVVTSPCILVRIPNGAYSRIQVVDQGGKLLGELSSF